MSVCIVLQAVVQLQATVHTGPFAVASIAPSCENLVGGDGNVDASVLKAPGNGQAHQGGERKEKLHLEVATAETVWEELRLLEVRIYIRDRRRLM